MMPTDWNNLITLSGWIVGVASFTFGVYAYMRSRIAKSLEIQDLCLDVLGVIPNGVPRPTLLVQNQAAETMFVTRIMLRNRGNSTIDEKDLREPIECKLHGAGQIHYTSLRNDDEADGFSVKSDGENVTIGWKFLDPGRIAQIYAFTPGFVEHVSYKTKLAVEVQVVSQARTNLLSRLMEVATITVFTAALMFVLAFFDGTYERREWTNLALVSATTPALMLFAAIVLWISGRFATKRAARQPPKVWPDLSSSLTS